MSADNYAEIRQHNGLWYIREFKLSYDLAPDEVQPFSAGEDPTNGKSFTTEGEAELYLDYMYNNGYWTEY